MAMNKENVMDNSQQLQVNISNARPSFGRRYRTHRTGSVVCPRFVSFPAINRTARHFP